MFSLFVLYFHAAAADTKQLFEGDIILKVSHCNYSTNNRAVFQDGYDYCVCSKLFEWAG